MKIAILNTYTSGGAGIACMRLVAALRAAGHQVSILTAENKSQKTDIQAVMSYTRWRFNFMAERLRWYWHEADKEVRFAFSLANWGKDISQHPAIQGADIIHLHWINQGFLSLDNLAQLAATQKPIVWTLHDMWAFTGGCHYAGSCRNYLNQCGNCVFTQKPNPTDISQQIFKQKQQVYTNFQNLSVVACSHWLANLAKESPLLKNAAVQNIPNPIDTELFKPVDKIAARQQLGLPLDKKLILFVAANVADKRKGFEWLQKGLELIKKDNPNSNLALLVMGKADTDILQKLPFEVHYLGILNKTEQIIQTYSAADVFAMPSLEDNLPNTIMESLACATPVLAFRIGGIPEMIIHQQTGYLAEPAQAEDFKNGLNWILNQPDSEILRQAARNFVLENYNFQRINAAYTAVYEQALTKI